MAIQLGRDSFVSFRENTGTTEVSTSSGRFLFAESFSFKREQQEQIVNEMTGLRSLRRRVVGNITCNATISRPVDPNNGNFLYRHILTGSVTTASQGSGTFLHTFAEGDFLPASETLQASVSEGGNSATTRNWFNGVVDSYGLTVKTGDLAKESLSFKFSNHGSTLNTSPAQSFSYVSPVNFNRCVMNLGESITAVSAVATREFSLNIKNNFEEDRQIGTSTVRYFTPGIREISGSFQVAFEDLTLYNRIINNTATSIRFDLSTSDVTSGTNHYIRILLPEVYFNSENPDAGNQNQLAQPINFSAIYGSNAAYQVQIQIFNSVTSVVLA